MAQRAGRTSDGFESPEQALDRRTFLHSAAAGVAALAAGRIPLPAPPDSTASQIGAARAAFLAPQATPPAFALDEVTIDQLQAWMTSGRYTARALVEQYLERIEEVDDAGPKLHAIIETNPDALAIAEALDAERKARGPRGPLHGIPVVLKDVVDTADRMHTTAGSLALAGSFAPRDAFIAARLRAAGAVLLGKANLSEWSNCRSTNATSGWSARGGLTKNPYVLDRSACGSSSGSGVAIAANLAAAGVGAETHGSIACPASANSLVGIKPTVGLLSRAGVIPVSYSQDSPGPMCRTVRDAAIMLGAMTGVDARDLATEGSQGRSHADYTTFLDRAGLKGARIGVLRSEIDPSGLTESVIERALEAMKSAGAILVDPVEIPSVEQLEAPEITVLLCEFRDMIQEYLIARGPDEPHKSLADLIRFNREHADVEMKYFGQEWFEASEQTNGRATPGYREALADCRRLARTEGIDRALAEHRLDAIVGLTSGPPFATDLLNGDRSVIGETALPAVSGYPSVTVPAGFVYGLPVGISFMAGAWSEPTLLKLAYAFEQATRVRRAPHFLPTIDFER